MKHSIGKRQYIQAAERILAQEGARGLTIRRVARDLNCNPANLYRYFSGLDELRAYASLGYLRDYLRDLQQLFAAETDPVARYFGVWECFSRHAFSHQEVFNQLFFSPAQEELDRVTHDYYRLFPDELDALGELRHVFLQGDFDFRDYLMLDELVHFGRIAPEDAAVLNKISVNLFRGSFKQVIDRGFDEEQQEREKEQFLCLLRFVFDKHLK